MKIWFPVITTNSGSDVFIKRLSAALKKLGIQTQASWFHRAFELAPFLLSGVRPPKGTAVIHAGTWSGFSFKRAQIPLVVTEHQGVFGSGNRPYRNIAQKIYHNVLIKRYVLASFKAASAVTTVSRFSASGLKKTLGFGAGEVIYNFVDTALFTPANEVLPSRRFRLLFVGNPSQLKGAHLLPQIMQKLGEKFELHFTAGLKNLSPGLSAENIICIGRLAKSEELIAAYQRCHAVLLPTYFEGFGYAALEAMACGKPVIASDNTALPEVVKHGVSGLLCPTGNIDAFVSACRYLAENPMACRAYGNAGRQRAEALFSESVVVPQYIQLYERLLA